MHRNHNIMDVYLPSGLTTKSAHFISVYDTTRIYHVPYNYDLTSLSFDDIPYYLTNIDIVVGRSVMAPPLISTKCRDIEPAKNILAKCPPGILLSKRQYMDITIKFKYDEKYIAENAEYDMEEDEYKEEMSYSDNEIEVYDGYQTRYGRRVHRRLKPTGKKIRRVLTRASLTVPSISMMFRPTHHSG